jgi:lysylphosphatidylglycerol synthetase-like protein (DUF2156 family)
MSRYFRLTAFVMGVILDALLAAAATFALASPSERVVSFAIIFLGLVAIPPVFAFWGWVKAVVVFVWPIKHLMVQDYLRVFRSGNFPYGDGAYGLDEYLSQVVDDETLEARVRIKAAHLSGQLGGLRVGRPFSIGLPNFIAAESALHKYQDQVALSQHGP